MPREWPVRELRIVTPAQGRDELSDPNFVNVYRRRSSGKLGMRGEFKVNGLDLRRVPLNRLGDYRENVLLFMQGLIGGEGMTTSLVMIPDESCLDHGRGLVYLTVKTVEGRLVMIRGEERGDPQAFWPRWHFEDIKKRPEAVRELLTRTGEFDYLDRCYVTCENGDLRVNPYLLDVVMARINSLLPGRGGVYVRHRDLESDLSFILAVRGKRVPKLENSLIPLAGEWRQ